MEKLKFTIEDAQIAELLGRQNYNSKEAAIFELVKNCYDSGSPMCNIYIEKNEILIEDFGCGMNQDDIRTHWMHVGKSIKGDQDVFKDRILSGSKGVGRFALARLGNFVTVKSKTIKEGLVIWKTNWEESTLSTSQQNSNQGTTIKINGLRDLWNKKDVEKLKDFLSRVIKSNQMDTFIYHEGELLCKVENIFSENNIGEHYVSKIILSYTSSDTSLKVEIESDEFKAEVRDLLGDFSEKYYLNNYDMVEELNKNVDELYDTLKSLGDFNAEFYFTLSSISADSKKFKYNYSNVLPASTGIILYRNDFSIVSFDGQKDWLDIASRARKSPAAATHQTGSWRVRNNQIYGMINIDKKININIKDLSNRQGLEEDKYYEVFRSIIQFGISRFERYRQSIIRKIDKPNKVEQSINVEKEHVKTFLKSPSNVIKMSNNELTSLAAEIKEIQRDAKEQSKARVESEKQHKYDVRILNVLATQGLRASAIGHELYNKRSALVNGYKDIVEALEEYGMWELLNSEEYTEFDYKNVPGILKELEDVNVKLITFIDVILKKIEKQKFNSKIDSIETTINQISDSWKSQYNWLEFRLEIQGEMPSKYKLSKDVIEVIFDNLILNSIQHNEMRHHMLIKLNVEYDGIYLKFNYADEGKGLKGKYLKDPMRILEVHESSRDDGHGLGMWILNNTLNMYSGEVKGIKGDNGFEIDFYIKG